MRYVVSSCFYISTKYYRNVPKGFRVTERTRNLFQIKQRVITPKVRKPELYATRRLVHIYISTKYHQNIRKCIQVTERTRSFTPTPTPILTPTPTGSVPKTICPTPLWWGGGGGRGGRASLRKHTYSNILKISPPKTESFQIKILIFFHISAQNIDCWYSLEPPRRGDSNKYPQSLFLSRNKKNNIFPCKSQFYHIKVGFKGVEII